jgi:hypothetical protein
MSKLLEKENNFERSSGNKRSILNREDYEYTLKNTFVNATILIAAISIYATFAYITIQYLKK